MACSISELSISSSFSTKFCHRGVVALFSGDKFSLAYSISGVTISSLFSGVKFSLPSSISELSISSSVSTKFCLRGAVTTFSGVIIALPCTISGSLWIPLSFLLLSIVFVSILLVS